MMKLLIILCLSLISSSAFCANQTATVSTVYPSDTLPFQIRIELADFALPNGLHSFVSATYKDQWLFIGGRTNGMHTFENNNNNFPPSAQNTLVYVVDLKTKTTTTKSLSDPTSGLTEHEIDLLSVTSAQSYQTGNTLYITGGYGVDTHSGLFSTKDCFTAINVPGLIRWVTDSDSSETAKEHIRQIFDPAFQVTGGYMTAVDKHHALLIFGQNFTGYYLPNSNGNYTEQVRKLHVHDNGKRLRVRLESSESPNPNYRRRDLNIVPTIIPTRRSYKPSFLALSGVFTENDGAWTVPVTIFPDGSTFMPDPSDPETFKQGMNNYACATAGLFSIHHKSAYTILLGGISFGYFSGENFETSPELPFINQVTTVRTDKHGNMKQYLMDAEYPVILSTNSNPGNTLLFGAGAKFMQLKDVPCYDNTVIKFDKIDDEPRLIGYIVGGIQSTVPNTVTASDSAASPYIFRVILVPVSSSSSF